MAAADPIPVSTAITYTPPTPTAAPADGAGLTFGDILSDLNPLQYLPVIGTIYRAVTGDTIPKPMREAGSVLVSGLMGGPIGVATSLGTLAFEKLTGIDFDDLGQSVLSAIRAELTPAAPAAAASTATIPSAPAAVPAAEPTPWTPSQLAAYGVTTLPDGTLRQGNLTGADVLNTLQLEATASARPSV